jgi:hypothetical protein
VSLGLVPARRIVSSMSSTTPTIDLSSYLGQDPASESCKSDVVLSYTAGRRCYADLVRDRLEEHGAISHLGSLSRQAKLYLDLKDPQ